MEEYMSNIKRKNIVRIKTNSDLSFVQAQQLLRHHNFLGNHVRNSDYAEIYWVSNYDNNQLRVQKDYQVEFLYEEGQYSIYVGFNSDWQGTVVAKHIFEEMVVPKCPFATYKEVKNYISGWDTDHKDEVHAREVCNEK